MKTFIKTITKTCLLYYSQVFGIIESSEVIYKILDSTIIKETGWELKRIITLFVPLLERGE